MQTKHCSGSTKLVLNLASLLAIASFVPGSCVAYAQSPGEERNHRIAPPEALVRLDGHTAFQVIDGTAVRVGHYDPEQKLRLTLAIYGCNGSVMDSRHTIFNSMLDQGWTLIAASGDRGATDDCNTAHDAVAYPGSDYDFIAAGGTSLDVYTDGTWDYEYAWTGGTAAGSCGKNNGGSGGGSSDFWGQLSWQSSFLNLGTNRLTPDLSLNAFGIGQNLYFNGSLSGNANGTSVVAPELAGFFAQENAYLLSIGDKCGSDGTAACAPIGPANYLIYDAGVLNNNTHNPFYDITSGCNSNDITAAGNLTYYCAGTGWDQVTGWGSANMMQLAWALNWELIPANGAPSVAFSGPAKNKWYNTDQIVSWTVNDNSLGFPGTGIAGFTQGWDSIPTDPASEAHGGTGNLFYSGPQFPNGSTGCLSFAGANGCEATLTQGCHTAYVHGWNNQGRTTAGQSANPESYGPVCFDNVPPTASAGVSPTPSGQGWNKSPVTVTLTATDPGGAGASGVSKIYFGINDQCTPGGPVANCGVYSVPFTFNKDGVYTIVYYSVDAAGNSSSTTGQNETYVRVMLDQTPPVTTAQFSGTLSGGVYYSAVNITMRVTDNLSDALYTEYQLDGGPVTYYDPGATPPIQIPVTAIGSHTFKYWSIDLAGNVETAHTVNFKIAGFAAAMSSPASSSTFSGTNATFTWGAATGATSYGLWLGTNGVGSNNLWGSGSTTSTSVTFGGLPTNGQTIYARLWTAFGGVSVHTDYSYTAASAAVLTSPAPNSTLTGTGATFQWTAPTGATAYDLWLGNAGVGSNNLWGSGSTTAKSVTFGGLPTNGETIYARLFTTLNGVSVHSDFTYTAATAAELTDPTPNSTFASSSETFMWTTAIGATQYSIWVGTSVGSNNLGYTFGGTTATSFTLNALPTNGEKIYVRLWTNYPGGGLAHNDYVYTAYTAGP